MFKIYGGATEFKQWELDQMVTNPCMKAGDEVVFRNASGETYVVKAFEQNGEVVADVPNYLLQDALNILVDLEQGADKHDDCRTTFVVVAQDKPEGYDCPCNLPDRPVKTAGGVSSWNDLTDKPFGTEIGMVEVLGETALETDEDGGFAAVVSTSVEVGKKYSVIWNGSEYEATAEVMDTGDQVLAVLGNMVATGGTDTGEPFFIGCAGASLFGYALDGSTSVTLSIRTEGEIVNQIDPKYIPGGAGGGGSFIVNAVATETMDGVASADKTYEEVASAFSGGVIPTVKMDMSGGAGFAYVIFPLITVAGGAFVFSMVMDGRTFLAQVDAESGWTLASMTE